MKKCYLDSNFLVYWKNDQAPQYKEAVTTLLTLRERDISIFVSPLILDEFIHAIILEARNHRSKHVFDDASIALKTLLDLPLLSVINPPTDRESHLKVIPLMQTYSLRPRDAYHLLTMQSNDIDGFATFDTDFAKVFAAKLLMRA